MSFKNLEQRYNESVTKLYAGAKTKFDGGKPSTGASDDPILVRAPGDEQKGLKNEGRGLPFVSAPRDVKRLTLFQLGKNGIVFLAKQQLLQTGNTFEHTRIINPAFVVGNAVPFLHIKRNLRPVQLPGLLGKLVPVGTTDTTPDGLRKIAQLQQETYDKAVGPTIGGFFKKILTSNPIGRTVSAVTAKRSVGESKSWQRSRPELGAANSDYVVYRKATSTTSTFKFGGKVVTPTFKSVRYGPINLSGSYTKYYSLDKRDYNNTTVLPALNATTRRLPITSTTPNTTRSSELSDAAKESGIKSLYNASKAQAFLNADQKRNKQLIDAYFTEFTSQREQPFLKYFIGDDESIQNPSQATNANARDLAATRSSTGKKKSISYLRDRLNLPTTKNRSTYKLDVPYRYLTAMGNTPDTPYFNDPVVVSFAMADKDHVQFRAFVKDLVQNANPEYKSYQYIGRIEKFITFTSIQREISFKLNIIAMSKSELDMVWTRINYLTGMVFPYGYNKGILQPNIVRLTIGNVYVNQPGYITSLNTSFSEVSETWDIDQQVPISATMDIKFVLIEKNTKTALSPFYGITENIPNLFGETTADGIPKSVDQAIALQKPAQVVKPPITPPQVPLRAPTTFPTRVSNP